MSGSNMLFMVILVLAVVVSVMMAAQNIRKRYHELEEDEQGSEGMKKGQTEDPEVTAAKKELYQYMNHAIRKMYQFYKKDQWDKLSWLEIPSEELRKRYTKILQVLSDSEKILLDDYFSCLDLDGKPGEEGQEEMAVKPGTVTDKEKLKRVFLQMMLPFYQLYYKELSELRHTALLGQDVLELFRHLTGKRLRMGYKNRYGTGVTAFRWHDDMFQVYDETGILLCDASFQSGKVWNGYAVIKEEYGEEDWDLYRKGTWKDGKFVDGTLQYLYKRPCN